ncbi:MAG: acyl-CoA desaturase [Flavobacteriales bacterium]|nr:acyl-CoA desaturase [Flavobacteriales bacterium]
MKSIIVLILYFSPLIILSTGLISSIWLLFLFYLISGIGMIGIGMGVMHDASHGAFSANKKLNKYLSLSLNFVGANAKIWHIQHVVLHHTYTNILDADDDINVPFLLRLSPQSKRYKIHRFQHIYAWIVYGLTTLSWITIKDFSSFVRYKKMGLIKEKTSIEIIKVISWKIIYYSFSLVLPILFLPIAPIWIILAFLTMHFFVGLFVATIFQLAHVVPSSEFPVSDEHGKIDNHWLIHQLNTTANFSPDSRIMSWFIGGLNYQIEHHLFPRISHVHYRDLSKIVQQTAKEFNIEYVVQTNLIQAIKGHAIQLRNLGRA